MTPSRQSHFREYGYLVLRGALRSQVRPVRDHVLSELKRKKIWASGKLLSNTLKDAPAFQQVGKLGQLIKCPDPATLICDEVRDVIQSLADAKLTTARDAQLLISLPNQGEWTLEALNWHVDVSSPDRHRLPGIQAFALVDDVRPHGGGTLAVAGSHRPENRDAVARFRTNARGGGDVAEELRSSELSLVEMAGDAGDVYLMDMRVLHTPAINATKHVRIMATARYLAS